jgi:SAM-dependent methyltransferase
MRKRLKALLRATGLFGIAARVAHHIPALRSDPVAQYLRGEHLPWSLPYRLYKRQFLEQTLRDPSLLERFRSAQELPPGFGRMLDERAVELPWAIARLDPGTARVLDAGSSLNHEHVLDHPVWTDKTLYLMTLAPEAVCFWQRGFSYIFGDLRDIPTRDGFYDTVMCVSTLEHIGLDNTLFTGAQAQAETAAGGFGAAMQEFRRVLRPGGRLLLTVPFGQYAALQTQVVFDSPSLRAALEAFGPAQTTATFFRYSAEGWQIADESACQGCQYVTWIALPTVERDRLPFPRQPDGAAAARAVACVELRKLAG